MEKSVITILTLILLAGQISAFEFCEDGEVGENNLRLISLDDMLKDNSKEWTWESYQEIELEARVENKDDSSGAYILEIIFKDGEKTVDIAEDEENLEKEIELKANERKSISIEFEVTEDIEIDEYEVYAKFYKKNSEDEECTENSEETVSIEKIEICEDGEVDKDELEISNIEDEEKDNDKSWNWAPGNDIAITLDLENKKLPETDFQVELIFLDEQNEEVFLSENSDDMIKSTTIDEDEEDDIAFNFKLRPDLEESEYTMYVKAYDEDDEEICTSEKAQTRANPITIKIQREERKVTVSEVKGPENAQTSSTIEYEATITNFGSKTEEKILARMYNYNLEIREEIEFEDVEAGEKRTANFIATIPENVSEKKYPLLFSVEYEYNEKQDYYKSLPDEEDEIRKYITISKKPEEKINEENKTNEKSNQTNEEGNQTLSNETKRNSTEEGKVITGNAIGTREKSPNWILLSILIILAIIGIYLFFKKPRMKKKKETTMETMPKPIRRYTAKLD
jgi:hypothetical protein